MNVTGGDGGPKHFGSLYTTTDYTSEAHVASAGLTFQATPQLLLHAQGNYFTTTASFDAPVLPEVTEEAHEAIEAGDWDYTGMAEYSDLDFEQFDVTFGGNYQLTPRTRIELNMTYRDLTDNAGYVYGYESGTLWIVHGGVGFSW